MAHHGKSTFPRVAALAGLSADDLAKVEEIEAEPDLGYTPPHPLTPVEIDLGVRGHARPPACVLHAGDPVPDNVHPIIVVKVDDLEVLDDYREHRPWFVVQVTADTAHQIEGTMWAADRCFAVYHHDPEARLDEDYARALGRVWDFNEPVDPTNFRPSVLTVAQWVEMGRRSVNVVRPSFCTFTAPVETVRRALRCLVGVQAVMVQVVKPSRAVAVYYVPGSDGCEATRMAVRSTVRHYLDSDCAVRLVEVDSMTLLRSDLGHLAGVACAMVHTIGKAVWVYYLPEVAGHAPTAVAVRECCQEHLAADVVCKIVEITPGKDGRNV